MAQFEDLTGQRFTYLLVTGRDTTKAWGKGRFFYLCDCGKVGSTYAYNLKSGSSTSCGCKTRGTLGDRVRTHGERGDPNRKTPTYQSWSAMWQRCTNPNNKRWLRYGGRGISVCARWRKFENFLADMGRRPEGLTLERKETDGPYEPNNCVWASDLVQANNRSGQRRYLVDGRLLTQTQLEHHWGLSYYITRKKVAAMTPHIESPT